MSQQVSFEDVLGCQAALYEWVESYDSKDWGRLSHCIAPTLRVDYRAFLGKLWPAMPADEFRAMASDPKVLGNPRVKTQHFIGVSKWSKESDTEITGFHQMRVAHQKYTDEKLTEVVAKGHSHGMGVTWFRKVDGSWKFAGIAPDIRWCEFNQEEIFEEGVEKFGESE